MTGSRRGIGALLWVLTLLAILIVLVTRLMHRAAIEEGIIESSRLERMAEIGFSNVQTMAVWHLEYDRRLEIERAKVRPDDNKPFDGHEDVWTLGPERPWVDPEDPELLIRWRLVDADSKLHLAALGEGNGLVSDHDRQRLLNFMTELQLPESEALMMSFIDWVDRAPQEIENEGDVGEIESDPNLFEQEARNAPLTLHAELGMIPGFTREILWRPDDIGRPGFVEWTTLHGSGRVNVNTAPPWVLMGMHPEITRSMARGIFDGRASLPYTSLEEVHNRITVPETVNLDSLFNVISNRFILEMEADYRGRRIQRRVFLVRPNDANAVTVASIERRGFFRWDQNTRNTMDDAVRKLLERLAERHLSSS